MNLVKIEDIGRECIDWNALIKGEDGNLKHGYVICFRKHEPKSYEINLDNVSFIQRIAYAVGDFKWIKNPLHQHWWDPEEKEAYLFTKTGTVNIIAVHMNDKTIFHIDGDKALEWLNSVSKAKML